MGQAKQILMDREANDDLVDFLRIMLERGELSGALEGIAKQATSKGLESLHVNQKNVIDSFVKKYKSTHECEVCLNGNVSSLTDYIEIADEGIVACVNTTKRNLCESKKQGFESIVQKIIISVCRGLKQSIGGLKKRLKNFNSKSLKK